MVLRPRHFRAIELLSGTDLLQREIARQVGVAPRTLGRWLKDDAFKEELARRRGLTHTRLEGLRRRTVRNLLLNVIRRLEEGEEKPPLKEVTQLLSCMATDELTASPQAAGDGGSQDPDDDELDLTPDQAERMWAIIAENAEDR